MKEEMTYREIEDIEREISEKNLDAVVSEMVDDWNESGSRDLKDTGREEIRHFIKGSLEPKEKSSRRVIYLRYIGLAAAVITGAFFVVRSLLPSEDVQSIFGEFYKPYRAITSVTRGAGNDLSSLYSSAITGYKNGKYEEALSGFLAITEKDPASLPAKFFTGITNVALGRYAQAIRPLEDVASAGGEYSKEASWYLGLARLMTGDMNGAENNFNSLRQSSGYYYKDADRILRRLK